MPGQAAKLARIPRIVYRRGSAKPIKNSILNRFLFKDIITHLLANSDKTKQTILAKNKDFSPEQSIKVVYNGINPNNTKNKI